MKTLEDTYKEIDGLRASLKKEKEKNRELNKKLNRVLPDYYCDLDCLNIRLIHLRDICSHTTDNVKRVSLLGQIKEIEYYMKEINDRINKARDVLNLKTYEVTTTRCGQVAVKAMSPEEAMNIVGQYNTDMITWDDDWSVTDVTELDKSE